jgi:Ca2+-binding RTX toxin-like protein
MSDSPAQSDEFRGSTITENPANAGYWTGEFQKHHIIPNSVYTEFADFLDGLVAYGYDHADFQTNGLWLPKDATDAMQMGLAQHDGFDSVHKAYNELVSEVVDRIRAEATDAIDTGVSAEVALQRAADNIKKLQIWLKEGFVARFDPDTQSVHPRLFVSKDDLTIPGGPGSEDAIRALNSRFTWEAIQTSRVFTDEAYRNHLATQASIFDPNLKNAKGEWVSIVERAAYFDGDVEVAARALGFDRISPTALLKNIDGSVGVYEAVLIGILGTAYAVSTLEVEDPLKQIVQDVREAFTWDNAQDLTAGVVTGITTYGIATYFFGPFGLAAVLAYDALTSVRSLAQALEALEQTFPRFEALHPIQDAVESLANSIDQLLPEFDLEISAPTVSIAQGEMVAHANADIDILIGFDKAKLEGGDSNDILVQFGVGDVHGGGGRDLIVAMETADIDAGAGDDFVLSFGQLSKIDLGAGDDVLLHAGSGSVVHGGAGNDTFFYTDGILIDDANGADTFRWYGVSLENALSWGAAEGGWAFFGDALGLVRGQVNGDGELGVQDMISMARQAMNTGPLPDDAFLMYFSNFNRDPLSDPSERTAGIRLANIELGAYQLLQGPSEEQRQLANNQSIWELTGQLVKEELGVLDGVDRQDIDPLVLDMDGDGIELSSRSGSRARFDVDGDGFAEQTGWVRGDDALLVADLNGNGKVDGFYELFGSPNDSGFAELKAYDSNDDGKVDASDALWGSLKVWQDKDGDGVTDAGELTGLTAAGIESLNVAFTAVDKSNAGNAIAGEGSYTKIGGGTGAIADVRFDANQFDTTYQGDTTIDPIAIDGMPNLKGHGTLCDLHVALSQDAARVPPTGLADVIDSVLPTLNVLDLGLLRDRAMEILQAWAHAAPDQAEGQGHQVFLYESVGGSDRVIDSAYEVRETVNGIEIAYWQRTSGSPVLDAQSQPIAHPTLAQVLAQSAGAGQHWAEAPIDAPDAGGNPDVVILIDRSENRPDIVNFALEVTETILIEGEPTQVTYWKLASGSVRDAQDNVIPYPTLAEVLAQTVTDPDRNWEVMPGATLDFVESYFGINVPLDDFDILQSGAIQPISDFLGKTEGIVELLAVRLAMQGPLAPYFDGVEYDVATDAFKPTTDRQLVPMFEAIFQAAPGDAAGASAWLASWEPIIDSMLVDYKRGASHLINSYAFIFTNIVAAHENVGLAIDVKSAAIQLGIPGSLVQDGSGLMLGTSENDIFYMDEGDDVAKGGDGPDTYVFGKNFGHDVIDDIEELASDFDQIRFAHLKEDEITAYREGTDLKLVVDATGETILVKNHFHEILPTLFGGNTAPKQGADEIIFADGTVWDRMDITLKVSHPEDTNDTLTATDQVDFLDGGKGNDTLIGGNNSDVYVFGKDYGTDTINDRTEDVNILIPSSDILMFRDELTQEDVTFSRGANLDDLIIKINGTSDTITIKSEFEATYTGTFGTQWLSRVEHFNFADGRTLNWDDIIEQLNAAAGTDQDDTIIGFDYEDDLDGGKGNDTLSGGNENDTYHFGFGDGHDIVDENMDNIISGSNDRILFDADVTAADVTFSRNGNSNNLIVTLKDGSSITVQSQFFTALTGGIRFDQVESFEFASDPNATIHWHQIYDILLNAAKTEGDDTIYGFDRADVIDGGAGNDFLDGGNDSDTYLFGIGSGSDTISDARDSVFFDDKDMVVFGEGIAIADLGIARSGSDLVLTVKSTGQTLTIAHQFSHPPFDTHGVEYFKFADGSVYDEAYFRERIFYPTDGDDSIAGTGWTDTLDGGKGNDTLQGLEGNDTLIGGLGDDVLQGGAGEDTYVFNLGDGKDTIYDWDVYVSTDKLVFGDGIAANDLVVTQSVSDPDDFVLSISGTTDQITLDEAFDTGQHGIEQFIFKDGTILGRNDIAAKVWASVVSSGDDTVNGSDGWNVIDGLAGNDTINGNGGDDTLIGGEGNDTLNGGDGNDTLVGGVGNDLLQGGGGGDTYQFNLGDGQDTIYDYYGLTATDKLVFGQGLSASQLVVTQSISDPDDFILSFTGLTDQITLNEAFNDSRYGIDQFIFADGTVLSRLDVAALVWASAVTSGDDTVTLAGLNDVIDGLAGNDTISGAGGADTLIGNSGDDVLNGNDGDDTLMGGLGNDLLRGAAGDDTYIFNLGDGQDTIYDSDGLLGNDKLIFGEGITVASITVTQSLADLDDFTIWINGTTDSVVLDEGFASANNGIDQFIFADGTVLTVQQIASLAWTAMTTSGADTINGSGLADTIDGLAGDDVINGLNGNDTLTGGLGNDVLKGGGGNDTYVFNLGDGQDTIYDYNDLFYTDKLVFGDGITSAMISAVRSSADLDDITLSISGSQDQILLDEAFNDSRYGIDQFIFKDGTVLTRTDVVNLVLATASTSGDDILIGDSGKNTLDGGAGNDSLQGGDGNDTYVFGLGYGADTIVDTDDVDKVVFGPGIDPDDVILSRAGNDLVLSVTGTADSLTIYNHFYWDKYQVESFEFADATTWNLADIASKFITGTSGADSLVGTIYSDTIDGGAGADTLTGGLGNDTYIVDNVGDLIVESSGEGIDLVKSSVSHTLAANVENLILTGSSNINGTGNSDNNSITGNSGANILDGGLGADTLIGGAGNDTYILDNIGDQAIESAGQGTDTIKASFTYVLGENFEHLTLLGSDAINGTGNSGANTITGNVAENVLDGGAGNDTLAGGGGNDTYFVDSSSDVVTEAVSEGIDLVKSSASFTLGANVENLTLLGDGDLNGTGNGLDNVIAGNTGSNTLDGGAGNDTLSGGLGNDTYVVDSAGDVLNENVDEGVDLVKSAVSWALAANFENLTLTGSAAINGTGNDVDNVLTGNGGANTLTGGAGNDTLNGAAGNDWLIGGTGDDTYIVDSASDVITEQSGEGTDSALTSVSYTISENVESLVLTGSGNISGTGNSGANTIIGNSGNNTLNGAGGADTLVGGAGNDTYVVDSIGDAVVESANEGVDTVQSGVTWELGAHIENLTLTGSANINGTGNELDNTLIGNGGANSLNGGNGNDTLLAGSGDDTLIGGDGDDWLDGDLGLDYLDGGAGNDTADYRYVSSTAWTFDLAAGTASSETMLSIENLYAGGGADKIYGSSVANYLNGGGGHDTIEGREGDDWLVGAAGNDTLDGGDGNDTLDGGSGTNTLKGGAGDDVYIISVTTNTITENAASGIDLVQSSVTHTLAANVENLTLTGTSAINGTGNTASNIIVGNSGANTLAGGDGDDFLEGGLGNDTLQGGLGNDVLRWDGSDTLDGGAGRDTLLYTNAGVLDLSPVGLTSIEAINLGVADDNANGLALSLADVLDLAATSSGTGLSANGDDIDLFIFGDAEGATVDGVTLTGGWTASGTIATADITGSTTTFALYISGSSQVAVQQGLEISAT